MTGMLDSFEKADVSAGALEMSDERVHGLRREWFRMGNAGTWFTGAERVALAQVAREALWGLGHSNESSNGLASTVLSPPAIKAAQIIAVDATALSESSIDRFESEGLSRYAYIEIVGIVARLIAVDTLTVGIGAGLEPLPVPKDGQPAELVPEGAKKRAAWVPMVGAANPVTALSGVTAECDAQRDLHGVLYLSYEEMGDLEIEKDLSRAQLELVAARTSLLNQCVF